MTTENRISALDPFLTTRSQFDLLLQEVGTVLLIDGDGLVVTNTVDRTDDPAVLITGSNNVFINQAGATLTGTGVRSLFSTAEGAVEITGTGNSVENQFGATITGAVGILSTGANTSIVNDGEILGIDPGIDSSDDSAGVLIGSDSSVLNRGLVSAEARSVANSILSGDRSTVQNDGTVEASGSFAWGIEVGAEGVIVNSGTVDVSTLRNSVGMLANGPGGSVRNSGVVRATLEGQFGNAFGIATSFDATGTTIWNGGTVEAITSAGGIAQGVLVSRGRLENEGTISAIESQAAASAQAIGAFLLFADGSNSGTISASAIEGLSVGAISLGGGSFANSGDILASGPQAFAVNTDDFGKLTNSGTIAATGLPGVSSGTSVALDFGSDASIGNLGVVHAGAGGEATAISATDRADIRNDGVVGAVGSFASGIEVASDGAVVNAVTGHVRAQGDNQAKGISAGDRAGIQNDGAVEAVGDFAFGIDIGRDGMIVNTGSVETAGTFLSRGLSGGISSTIHNLGAVHVEAFGQGTTAFGAVAPDSGLVANWGTIEAVTDDGNALAILAPGIERRVENYGELRAVSTGSYGNSRSDGLVLFASSGLNAGSILASATSGASAGALLGHGGRLDNTGDITAIGPQAIGVGLGDWTELTNTGTITAIGPGAKAVVADAGTVVTNDGVISAQSADVGSPSVGFAFETTSQAQKTIVNSGTIVADIAILDTVATPFPDSDVLTIENSGLIAGTVDLGFGVDIVFNTGQIDGDVHLGAGDDLFDGRGGVVNGTVFGGDGDDVIRGGAGNDILVGDTGADIIAGGAGADAIDGGDGLDTLDYSDSLAGVQVFLGDATTSTTATVNGAAGTAFGGDAEGDTFQNIEKVVGSAFDDFVYGAPGGSIVELGDGNDVFDNEAALLSEDLIVLGAGNDVARAGDGADLVRGGAGQDQLHGEDGSDFLLGEDGEDLLFGGGGVDLLDGGAGSDVISGGGGGDRLDGGTGNDLLHGGGGDDLFVFGPGGGHDGLLDFDAGAGSEDVIDLGAFDTILSFDDVLGVATQTGHGIFASTVLTFDADTTLTLFGVKLAEIDQSDFLLAMV